MTPARREERGCQRDGQIGMPGRQTFLNFPYATTSERGVRPDSPKKENKQEWMTNVPLCALAGYLRLVQ